MRYRKTTWLVPLLAALYGASCAGQDRGQYDQNGRWRALLPSPVEMDVRVALCAWALTMMLLLVGLQIMSFEKKDRS